MVITGLIEKILILLNGLLGHFVVSSRPALSMTPDYEWAYYPSTNTLTAKGNFLLGAVADIATYGAILGDWLVQSLIGVQFDLNDPAN